MSTLTGQQIKNTYQGLLKLQNSTSGITQNLQSIQDGLGGDTGLRISTTQLESFNNISYIPYKGQFYGQGYGSGVGAQFAAGTQNVILTSIFYDNGNYDYSAITFNVVQQTSTNDTFEFAIYNSQMINPFGLFPYQPIISGLTADTTTTGLKTTIFPTPITMSGEGAGFYFLVYKINNAGVQPTVRFGQSVGGSIFANTSYLQYGFIQALAANQFSQLPTRANAANGTFSIFSGLTTFNNPYANNINTLQSTTASVAGNGAGFVLHTII